MSVINQIGNVLLKIDPVEYTVVAAALATFFHSRLAKVWTALQANKALNVTLSMALPLVLGALRAAPESVNFLNYVHNLVVNGSPIYLAGQAFYYSWTRKWEQLEQLQQAPVINLATGTHTDTTATVSTMSIPQDF